LALLLLCAGLSCVRAQGGGAAWDRLNQEAMTLYDAGKYDRAVVAARKALEVAEQKFGPDQPYVAMSLNHLALLYHTQGESAKA
jgi:hypothetical protein